MSFTKILLICIGCLFLALGALGVVIPILPTFPFLLVSTCCFANSSKKLDTWFKGTKLYKNNFAEYAKGNGMTWKAKIKIMVFVTVLMSVGFILMGRQGIITGCIVLSIVWLFHVIYFCFGVKTLRKNNNV